MERAQPDDGGAAIRADHAARALRRLLGRRLSARLYNYHYLLDDLQWIHSAAYPDAGLALDNGEVLGVGNLGVLLLGDNPPFGWSTRNYLPALLHCLQLRRWSSAAGRDARRGSRRSPSSSS